MNLADTLRGLLRRWYIVVPGLLLAVAISVTSFIMVKPGYERTATQLLLPGSGLVPEGATNPYLFLGGLTQATDILIRSMSAEQSLGPVLEKYPGTEVEVARDPLSSGPVILFRVTGESDEASGGALTMLLNTSVATLDQLQTEQGVKDVDRITIRTLTEDTIGVPQQRTRVLISAAAGVAGVALTLVIASFVDGLVRRSRYRGRAKGQDTKVSTSEEEGALVRDDGDDGMGEPGSEPEPPTAMPEGNTRQIISASRLDATPSTVQEQQRPDENQGNSQTGRLRRRGR